MNAPFSPEVQATTSEGHVTIIDKEGAEYKINRYAVRRQDGGIATIYHGKPEDELALGVWFGFENSPDIYTNPVRRAEELKKLEDKIGDRGIQIMDQYRVYVQKIKDNNTRDGKIEGEIGEFIPWIAHNNLLLLYERAETANIAGTLREEAFPVKPSTQSTVEKVLDALNAS